MKAILFLGDPTDLRTQQEVEIELKVCGGLMSRWKQRSDFMEAVRKELDKNKNSVRPGVWKQAYRHAIGPSTADRRLLMEATGDIKSKTEVRAEIGVTVKMPNETADWEKGTKKK